MQVQSRKLNQLINLFIYLVLRDLTQFTENSFALIPAQVEDGGPYHGHGTSQHRFL